MVSNANRLFLVLTCSRNAYGSSTWTRRLITGRSHDHLPEFTTTHSTRPQSRTQRSGLNFSETFKTTHHIRPFILSGAERNMCRELVGNALGSVSSRLLGKQQAL